MKDYNEDDIDVNDTWLQVVIRDGGAWCKNCENAWRILKADDDGSLRIIEDCYGCDDEAFDIYDMEDDK